MAGRRIRLNWLQFLWLLIVPQYLSAAPLTPENAPYNVNRAVGVVNPANYYGEWPGHQYTASPNDWREIGIYQILTDRFRDGNPLNNEGAYGGYAPGAIDLRHGGDFTGVTDKLDYIKGLGFDAIWISPIFQNLYGSPAGYGQIDFTLLDDRFGTLEELRKLINEAHRRKMYVLVDIVVNHLSYVYYPEGHKDSMAPFRVHKGEYRLFPRLTVPQSYADFKVDNNFISEGTYCDVYGQDGNRYVDESGQGSFWDSDLHHNGSLTSYPDPWNNHLGSIYGRYDDLRLCSARVQDKIIAMTKALVSSTDIDGIRLDTPMQVPLEFYKRWTPLVKEHASSLGKKNFFVVGETYAPPRKAATLIGRGKTPEMYNNPEKFIDDASAMDSGIDYGFHHTFVDPIFRDLKSKPIAYFKALLTAQEKMFDLFDPKIGRRSSRMLLFFDNHDQRRLAATPDGIRKVQLASLMIALWPGIPLYYHGSEQEFSSYGIALDGHAREDMMTSLAWKSHPSAVSPNKASNDNFDMAGETYLEVQRIMDLRRNFIDLLMEDKITPLWSLPIQRGTLMSFAREGQKEEKLQVILNISPDPAVLGEGDLKAASICTSKCELRDLLNGEGPFETSVNGEFVKLALRPFEGKVLYSGGRTPIFSPRVVKITPAHDQVVPLGSHEITIEFDSTMNSASLAAELRFNGQRVDAALIKSPDGKKFSFKAQANNGINSLTIGSDAKSSQNLKLAANFSARFRSGSMENVIIDPQIGSDDSLINSGAVSTEVPNVTLHHKAQGAKLFRAKNEPSGTWSEWKPYVEKSEWSIEGTGPGWKGVTVQYWTDGSSAYYVSDGIDYVLPDGVPITDLSSAETK